MQWYAASAHLPSLLSFHPLPYRVCSGLVGLTAGAKSPALRASSEKFRGQHIFKCSIKQEQRLGAQIGVLVLYVCCLNPYSLNFADHPWFIGCHVCLAFSCCACCYFEVVFRPSFSTTMNLRWMIGVLHLQVIWSSLLVLIISLALLFIQRYFRR